MNCDQIEELNFVLDNLDTSIDLLYTCITALESSEFKDDPISTLHNLLIPLLVRIKMTVEDLRDEDEEEYESSTKDSVDRINCLINQLKGNL